MRSKMEVLLRQLEKAKVQLVCLKLFRAELCRHLVYLVLKGRDLFLLVGQAVLQTADLVRHAALGLQLDQHLLLQQIDACVLPQQHRQVVICYKQISHYNEGSSNSKYQQPKVLWTVSLQLFLFHFIFKLEWFVQPSWRRVDLWLHH